MQLIFWDKQKRVVRGKEDIRFSGFYSFYLITVTARVKSRKQLSGEATDDEDLVVKVDSKTFPALGKVGRLVDSPAAFSGGRLHNLAKTVYFLTFLKGRDHKIVLESDKPSETATFEDLEVYTFNPTASFALESKISAEDGDRRPWLTFVLDDFPLRMVSAKITYSRRRRDSDDVKVIVDGQVQINLLRDIKHFLWRFVGSFLPWSSPQKTVTEIFSLDLPQKLHYIELEADRMPSLDKVIFDFGKDLLVPGGVPTISEPEWTGSFYDDTELVILARAVYGEAGGESKEAKIAVAWAIRNRVEDSKNRWGKTYHDVILAKYQYEPFNDPSKDVFKKITRPPLDNLLEKRVWEDSYNASLDVVLKRISDPTNGANHFYSVSSLSKPLWAVEDKFTTQIGATRFYRL